MTPPPTSAARTVGPYAVPGHYVGACRDRLAALPDRVVQCVVTSPPYWGPRDYGLGPDQLGLEASPERYVERLVEVFRDVHRVLRDDGVLWLNLGDTYVSHVNGNADLVRNPGIGGDRQAPRPGHVNTMGAGHQALKTSPNRTRVPGYKDKDLVGAPWMVALALRRDGWWLRQCVIWSKNASPESVRDRPSTEHEYVFLLAKRGKYFYDQDAIREPFADYRTNKTGSTALRAQVQSRPAGGYDGADRWYHPGGRNARSIWRVPVEGYDGAHFATFPVELARRCIVAGSAPRACARCGAPWRRRVRVRYEDPRSGQIFESRRQAPQSSWKRLVRHHEQLGWHPGCRHDDGSARCLVLDPFMGSGTVARAATVLGRDWLGFDADPRCAELVAGRVHGAQLEVPGL